MDSPGRRRLTTLSNKFLSAVTRFSTWFKSCVGKSREGLYFLDGPSCEQHPKSFGAACPHSLDSVPEGWWMHRGRLTAHT